VKNGEKMRKNDKRLRKIRTFWVKMSKNVFVLRIAYVGENQKLKIKV